MGGAAQSASTNLPFNYYVSKLGVGGLVNYCADNANRDGGFKIRENLVT